MIRKTTAITLCFLVAFGAEVVPSQTGPLAALRPVTTRLVNAWTSANYPRIPLSQRIEIVENLTKDLDSDIASIFVSRILKSGQKEHVFERLLYLREIAPDSSPSDLRYEINEILGTPPSDAKRDTSKARSAAQKVIRERICGHIKPALRTIATELKQGTSVRKIAEKLNELNIPAPGRRAAHYRGDGWSHQAVGRVIEHAERCGFGNLFAQIE